jgi:hypothetical protein
MTALTMAAVATQFANARYDYDLDLPLPNIYWCTADMPGHAKRHTHLAADHTIAVVQKMANHCAEHHGFRPMRSNSRLKVRRLKLGDLMENADAYDVALANARAAGERDIVVALLKLPAWIAAHLSGTTTSTTRQLRPATPITTPRPPIDYEAAWNELQAEIAALVPAA